MTASDLRPELFASLDWYADVVDRVQDAQLALPTPCSDFDVRHLMTHMVTVMDKIVAFGEIHRDPYAGTHESPEALVELTERKAAEVVDPRTPQQRADDLRAQTRKARAVWTDEVLDTDISLGWGPVLPGRTVLGIYVMEVLSHGWDLATATAQDAEAPAEVAEVGLAAAQAALPQERDAATLNVFGAVVPSAPDAGPTERLANWTGRRSR